MKTVFFLRHGECESNVKNSPYLGKNAKLTNEGIRDTKRIIPLLNRLEIELVVSSSSVRALETAKIITTIDNLKLVTTDLFVEREHPSELIGITHEDGKFRSVKDKVSESFAKDESYSDEESFKELCERSIRFRQYLENLPENRILVVGHGKFTKFFLAHLCFGGELTPNIYLKTINKLGQSFNLGLSEARFDEDSKLWHLYQWNANLPSLM